MDPHRWVEYASRHGHELRISASEDAVVIVADDTDALRWARRLRPLMADEWNVVVMSNEEYKQEGI